MEKHRGNCIGEFLILIFLVLFVAAGIECRSVWEKSSPEFKAERQLEECSKEISSGSRYVTVKLPISSDVERLLKEEHYEVYMRLEENKKIIYKKNDEATKKEEQKK